MTFLSGQIDRLSLGGKINLTVLLSCCAALAIVACLHIAKEVSDFRPRLEAENRKLAQVVAANVSAAVLFNDVEAMSENLDAFSQIPEVYAAEIHGADGRILASYFSPRHADKLHHPEYQGRGSFLIVTPVVVRGDRVGMLELVIGLDALDDAIRNFLNATAMALLISLVPAMLVVRLLKPTVLKPMTRLRETMERITETQDFAARVDKGVNDEFGDLAIRFNAMLDEIQRRDQRLAKAAEEMTAAKDFAEAANATKTKFIANMSHELRTPLNAIIGYSEILVEDLDDSGHETQIQDLHRILGAALHLLDLINEVLDVAKIEAGKLELHIKPANICEIIHDAAESVRPAAAKNGNDLTCSIEPDLGTMPVDEIRFRQCLLNLLSNACKFTENGRIDLRAFVDRSGSVPELAIEIKDSGIGIAADRLDSLFEPFVQVDSSMTRSHGGSGLGLAITRDLLALMSGRISVVSRLGSGSTFSIRMPIAQNPLPMLPREPASTIAAGHCDVLVIEDAVDSATLLSRWLASGGFDAEIMGTGAAGIEAAHRLSPDLVILDIDLPDMTGWRVLEELVGGVGGRTIPVVVLTVSEDRARALALGAWDLITKPVQKARLIEIVEAHVVPPPARVQLHLPPDLALFLTVALEAAGHHVALDAEPVPGFPGEERSQVDCVVMEPSQAAASHHRQQGAAELILWCGRPGAGQVHDIEGLPARAVASRSELLVAVRRCVLERQGEHAGA